TMAESDAGLARETVGAAQRSHDAVQNAVATMHEISQASQRIADITQVIEGVEFQTNILALDAAVEAPRAGGQGRGVPDGANEARMRMDEAMGAIERVMHSLDRIHDASQEQAAGIGRVNTSVTQLDDITQQNAAMVEELAAAASSLNEQTSVVYDTIRVFRLSDRDVSLAEVDAVELRRQNRALADAQDGQPAGESRKLKLLAA